MFERSARVTSEQNPSAALSPPPIAAKVRRASFVDSRPRTDLPRSTIIGPDSTAASGFWDRKNSGSWEIWVFSPRCEKHAAEKARIPKGSEHHPTDKEQADGFVRGIEIPPVPPGKKIAPPHRFLQFQTRL